MTTSLTICLDFDDTFTADPELWTAFILSATSRGHTVVCVTGRDDGPWHLPPYHHAGDEIRQVLAEVGIPIVFAGVKKTKKQAALEAGYEVHIWIDDKPQMVHGLLYD